MSDMSSARIYQHQGSGESERVASASWFLHWNTMFVVTSGAFNVVIIGVILQSSLHRLGQQHLSAYLSAILCPMYSSILVFSTFSNLFNSSSAYSTSIQASTADAGSLLAAPFSSPVPDRLRSCPRFSTVVFLRRNGRVVDVSRRF